MYVMVQNPEEVEFALTVLERLAKRYGQREGLYGIEVLNEPISFLVYATAPSTGKAVDKEEAKGSGYVPLPFLENFYRNAYRRLRKILPENKTIVFHDGFRLRHWGKFFRKEHMKNVVLDTHIYIFAMESFVPIHMPWVYQIYIKSQQRLIERIQRDVPVVVGEWCICNKYAEKAVSQAKSEETAAKEKQEKTTSEVKLAEDISDKSAKVIEQDELRKKRYLEIAAMQLQAWESGAGWIYWSYQLNQIERSLLMKSGKKAGIFQDVWKTAGLNSRTDKKKVTLREMIFGYFLGPLLVLSMTSVVASYYLTFYRTYEDVVNQRVFLTVLPLISVIPMALSNIVIGIMVGKTRTKQGKARPYILMAAPMLLISGILVFCIPYFSLGVRMVWMVVTYNLFAAIANPVYGTSHYLMVSLSTRDWIREESFPLFRIFRRWQETV